MRKDRKGRYSRERGARDERIVGEDAGNEEAKHGWKAFIGATYRTAEPISLPAVAVPKEPFVERMGGIAALSSCFTCNSYLVCDD